MPLRNYSSTTPVTSLTTGISDTDTTITITNYGDVWPSAPFTLLLSHDTANEEVVEVTSKNGTNNFFTITRGIDGTTPKTHSAGAEVVHGVSARDFGEANTYINAAAPIVWQDSEPVDPADGMVWIDSDSTAETLNPNEYVANALVDVKGDIIAATSDNTVARVAVGTDGQVLTADSGAAAGLAWADVAGPTDLTLRHTVTATGSVSIPAGITYVYAIAVGGGGGGGYGNSSGGGGGGGAGVVQGWVPATSSVTIGAGGAGGVVSPQTFPISGGTTIYSMLSAAGGGRGGRGGQSGTVGAPGGGGGGGGGVTGGASGGSHGTGVGGAGGGSGAAGNPGAGSGGSGGGSGGETGGSDGGVGGSNAFGTGGGGGGGWSAVGSDGGAGHGGAGGSGTVANPGSGGGGGGWLAAGSDGSTSIGGAGGSGGGGGGGGRVNVDGGAGGDGCVLIYY